ncbi:MAG: hypothetical protein RLW62_01865 [Gammaproteobacteria bacterium]
MRNAVNFPRLARLLAATTVAGFVAATGAAPGAATAPRLVPQQTLAETINFATLTVRDGRISAVVENRGDRMLDDIVVMVRYHWLWNDEDDPGADNPGWTELVTLDQRLLPGERVPFVYTPREPLPRRDDGWFMPSAEVVGATVYAAAE